MTRRRLVDILKISNAFGEDDCQISTKWPGQRSAGPPRDDFDQPICPEFEARAVPLAQHRHVGRDRLGLFRRRQSRHAAFGDALAVEIKVYRQELTAARPSLKSQIATTEREKRGSA